MAETKQPKKGTGPVTTRAKQERAKKLREIRKQVKDGTLTIRKMTAAERKKYPPQNRSRRRTRAR